MTNPASADYGTRRSPERRLRPGTGAAFQKGALMRWALFHSIGAVAYALLAVWFFLHDRDLTNGFLCLLLSHNERNISGRILNEARQ